jgi:simple sugar transport system ATP-binding protein
VDRAEQDLPKGTVRSASDPLRPPQVSPSDNSPEHGVPVIELRDVSRSFGSMRALHNVNFRVFEGEIVGLLGDNGAGKSTLIKTLAGVVSPDSGDIHVRGQKMTSWTPHMARRRKIETVYQDKALAEQQTIARNIFAGRELTNRLGFLRLRDERAEAERLMRSIGFTSKVFSPDSIIRKLSGGERQGVAIARALYFKADLIILDEPTAALSLTETEKVLGFIRQIKREGSAAVFVSHNIYHVCAVVDRLVLMDRGRVMREVRNDETSAEEIMKELNDLAYTHGE